MAELLFRFLMMSFTAGCIVPVVLVLRLLMQKLPKGFSYALWFVVLFRFLCPVSIPSSFSLLPVQPKPMLHEIIREESPELVMSMFGVYQAAIEPGVNPTGEEPLAAAEAGWTVELVGRVLLVFLAVWANGMMFLLFYGLFRHYRLRQRLATAIRAEKGIYESDQINGAFLTGIFRPAIYLPAGLDDVSRRYILCHERAHITRRDYLVKLAGSLMVTLHWFNPLAWISFHYLCRDMEMACDERVLKMLRPEERKTYSLALLKAEERGSGLSALAFGESSTKLRIKNILNYRKPRFWVSLLLSVLLLCAGIGLATNPVEPDAVMTTIFIYRDVDGPTSIFRAGKSGGEEEPDGNAGTTTIDQMPDDEWLANTTFTVTFPGEENSGGISLDMAMGTDGPMSNNALNILSQMSLASRCQKLRYKDRSALPCNQVVRMGTIEGAKAVGLDHLIGSLEIGKKADIVILETDSVNMAPIYDYYGAVVYSANASNVETTIVNGTIVVRNKRLVSADIGRLRANLLSYHDEITKVSEDIISEIAVKYDLSQKLNY